MQQLEPGAVFAGHRIEGLAGRGGMGVVYKATHLALDQTRALKLIAGELAADPTFQERFKRESRLAAAIDHPNVVPVYDAGEVEGVLYSAMRFVEGTDLRTLLADGKPVAPARAAKIVAEIADALEAAHARGL